MANEADAPVMRMQLTSSSANSRRESSSGSRHPSIGSSNCITYGKTWTEDIQNYKTGKSVLPWLPEQQTPVKYVTRYEKSRKEREYDIVLGRYRDEDQEMGCQQREGIQLKRALEKGRAKQLRMIQRFDIISNAAMYPGAKDPADKQPVAHPNKKKGMTDYDILTNIPFSGSAPLVKSSPSNKPHRDFNILTNEYNGRHDDRFEQEATQAKQVAAQKYLKTHVFDPVRVAYMNEDHEKEFLACRNKEQQVHGKDRVLTLPPSEQFSEGRLYDILNQRVINSEKLIAMNEKDQRAFNKIKKAALEAEMRKAGEKQQARETDLCLNRFSHERYSESRSHGYDVLSNQPFAGRNAKLVAHPRTHSRLSPWQTIESGLLVNNRVAPKLSSATAATNARPPSFSYARDVTTDKNEPDILVLNHPSDMTQSLKTMSPALNRADVAQAIVRSSGFSS